MKHPRIQRTQYETKVIWSYFGGLALVVAAVVSGIIAIIVSISVGVSMAKSKDSAPQVREVPVEIPKEVPKESRRDSHSNQDDCFTKFFESDFGLSREYLEMMNHPRMGGSSPSTYGISGDIYSDPNIESVVIVNY